MKIQTVFKTRREIKNVVNILNDTLGWFEKNIVVFYFFYSKFYA